jgi:hypothetical protein
MVFVRAERRLKALLGLAATVVCVAVVWIRGAPDRAFVAWLGVIVGLRMVSEVIWPGAWATVSERWPWFLPLSFAVCLGGIPVVDGAGPLLVVAMAVGGGVIGAATVIAGQRLQQREAGGSEDVT